MWLALFLAALDDTVGVDARRAASHEVGRRLGIGWKREGRRPPVLPFAIRICQEAEEVHRLFSSDGFARDTRLRALVRFSNRVFQMLPPDSAESSRTWAYLADVDLGDEGSVSAALMKEVSLPATPMDRLVDWLLLAWREPDPILDRLPGELDQMAAALPSIQDWAAETNQDPTRLSWEEARRRSEAWHRTRFVGARLGEPAPDALVVVRDDAGWTLQRLLTRRDFIVEGGAMGHCVGGPLDEEGQPSGESHYIQSSRDGEKAFFSVRRPDQRIAATIEVVLRLPASDQVPKIVQVQGPEDGPVADAAVEKIASLFAEAGEPFLPKEFRRRPDLGGVYVVPQKDRVSDAVETPFVYADALLHGVPPGLPSFDASIADGMQAAAERPGVWGSDVGESTIYHALLRWFSEVRTRREWYGFMARIGGDAAFRSLSPPIQFRRSTPETWRTVTGPFTPGLGTVVDNSFFPAESPAAAVLLSLGLPVSSIETSRQLYPDLSDEQRSRVFMAKLDSFSPTARWTSVLSRPG